MDYEGFKVQILRLTGIDLGNYKEKQMKRRIDSLISKNNYSTYDSYLTALRTDSAIYNEFINYITINVSEFFRNKEQWELLEKNIILEQLKKDKILKIWSAACSTGDEPYTLVLLLSRHLPLSSIKIIATDIDGEAINKAKIGLYNAKSVQSVPRDLLEKYFVRDGDMYQVKDEIKRCVEFKKHNLFRDEYPSDCNLIVCRNVLIYFTDEAKNSIYSKFYKSLKKDGVLFVGCTEQIIAASDFNLRQLGTYFYMKE